MAVEQIDTTVLTGAVIAFLGIAGKYITYELNKIQTKDKEVETKVETKSTQSSDAEKIEQIRNLMQEQKVDLDLYTNAKNHIRNLLSETESAKVRLQMQVNTGDAGRDLLALEYGCFRLNLIRDFCNDLLNKIEQFKLRCSLSNCSTLKNELTHYYTDFIRRAYTIREIVGLKAESSNKVFEHEDYLVLDIWVRKYQDRSMSKEDVILNVIESLECDNLESCVESIEYLTQSIILMIKLMVSDSRNVSKTLNGDLTGKVFLSTKIGDVKH